MNSDANEFWSSAVIRETSFLMSYALMKTGCRHRAADIVQDVFLAAIRSGTQPTNARSYLAKAIRRRVAECSRARTEDSIESHDVAEANEEPPALESDVWKTVAQLSPDFQEVITMRIKGELSFAEISEILGVPIGTATSRYSRALAELRRRLSPG